MIELRRKLERWLGHPVLGPLLLLLLALVAAMTVLHAAHDDHGGAAGLGMVYLVIFTALGPVVLGRVLLLAPSRRVRRPVDRGPPRAAVAVAAARRLDPRRTLTLPLLH